MNALLKNPVIAAALNELDPYGNLTYVVGSSDDFICFDFAHALNPEARGIGEDFYIVKATLNSETGGFIQEFGTWVFENGDSPLKNILEIVAQALDWCADNGVKHNASGWAQDPYYIVRTMVLHWHKSIDGADIPQITPRQIRRGGKRINRFVGLAQELQVVYSEVRG